MMSIAANFYDAFQAKDWQEMTSLYHADAVFSDPAFGTLNSTEVKTMWKMLCEQGKDLTMTYQIISENENGAKVQWEAMYTFSKTGKKVHNIILAELSYQDGCIIAHHDVFDLYRWSRQALGLQGWLIGWSGFFREKLQQQTRSILKKYMAKQ